MTQYNYNYVVFKVPESVETIKTENVNIMYSVLTEMQVTDNN